MRLLKLAALLLITLLAHGVASASVIYLDSVPGLRTGWGTIFTVAITPNTGSWQGNNPANPGDPTDHAAVWISFQDSGVNGTQFVPSDLNGPVASIFRDFASGAGDLILNVWADDSAGVYLDGIEIIAPLTTTGAICSGGVIGCRPSDVGTYHQAIGAGNHTLRFDLYQTGRGLDTATNPTGMLFTGTAPGPTDPTVPEPASLVLMGSGLAGVWIVRRRRNRAA